MDVKHSIITTISQSACFDPDYCPYLKSQMTEIEKTEGEIKVLQAKLELLKEMEKHKTPCEEAYKDAYGAYPMGEPFWIVFKKGYDASQKDYKVGVDEPSMINCVLLGNPPDGYVAWSEWYNEMGSKGILHNLKISSKDYQPTPQERGERFHKDVERCVRESVKWCEENPDKDPLDWLKPQTPEQTAQSLKEAFVKAQQTEDWKETQKLIDEEDNDKNFKNSLDLIKEWGEKNKPPTLYEILMEWWINHLDMEQSDEEIVDGLVNIIGEKFIPPSSDTNGYEWEKCLKMMRENLR